MTISLQRLEELNNIPDSDIDTSDIPELDRNFWDNAKKINSQFHQILPTQSSAPNPAPTEDR
jgi:hypothetical protein